ncbi:hypothetical protein M413DRAFT_441961 [Hebeloma cylindrosporum]|uniref:Uncharacterized protein n=1 Tax=Hebeloma cylindrosporum TaxID=76867 RepID=A0A0C3CMD1_HEBCY|nr:hypothetical protein M413DRAFT_441961 [Hebeloma cylindrosporum h7]
MTTSISFSSFQFKTIGQQPELLKRISAPDPDREEDLDIGSHSPSISPVSAKDLPVDSSTEVPKQPSLHSRLSLADRIMINQNGSDDVQMQDASIDQPNGLLTRSLATPSINLLSTNQSLNKDNTAGMVVSANRRNLPPHTMNVPGASSPHDTESDSPITLAPHTSNLSRLSAGRNFGINPQSSSRPSSSQSIAATSISRPGTPNNSTPSVTTDASTFAIFRQLQARIASSIAKLKPISTENVLLLAQSVKEQQRGVLTSVYRAQTLAQQALDSAQASVTACHNCLKVAESTQVQIDELMIAIENVGGAEPASVWNVGLEALRADFLQLRDWARDLENNEIQRQRDIKETEAKLRSEERTQGPSTKRIGSSLTPQPAQAPAVNPNLLPLSSVLVAVEHEADAAARAWDQLREQSAERRKLAEAELRKHRDAEERLEQEQKQAQALVEAREAELARIRAERIEAERREKARQEKEAEEAELRRKELDRMREGALQIQLAQRKASEERRLAEKALQVEKDMAAKRLADEQKRRDIEASEALARRLEEERAKAIEAEALRQHLLQEQEVKRQEIVAQKHRANAETAKKIHAERAKEKEANRIVSIEKSITPPHQHALPSSGQSTVAPSKFDLGNTSTTAAGAGPDGKSVGASAKSSTDDTNTSRPITTSPKVSRVDQSESSSDLLSTNHVLANDPNFSTQPRYTNPTQHYQSASANTITSSSNGSATFHEDSWVIPSTSPRQPASNAFVGSDVFNIPLIPRSLVQPISPEAQKANLRRLIDANRLSSPIIKHDPDEEQLAKEMERNSALPPKVKVTNVPKTSNPPAKIGLQKPKEEPLTDIPLLFSPSPSPSLPAKVDSSISPPLNPEPARAGSQNAPRQKQINAAGPAVGNPQPSTKLTAINVTPTAVDISSTSSTRAQQVTVVSKPIVASLPRPPLPMPKNQSFGPVSHDPVTNDDNLLASRMGPDASTLTNGWSLAGPVQEDVIDPRNRARAARPPGHDHYSPPPSSANTRGPTRPRPLPRRVDHYSPPPRRASERLPPAHNDYPRSRSRSGGSSRNSSRCASPDAGPRHYVRRDDGPTDILPPNLLGQKRQRVEEQPAGPPPRRPRYGADINNQAVPRIGTARPSYPGEDEWSHLANYERSPTPEPCVTPLFNRIEDAPLTSTAFRGGQISNTYRPDPQNDRRPAGFKQQHASQGQPSSGSYTYQSNNPQRQNYRSPEDVSRPNLLKRFTDSAQPGQGDDGYPPPRSYRGRHPKPFGRGGPHPPLEQRLSNNPNNPSLMTRMQGPTGYQRPNNA